MKISISKTYHYNTVNVEYEVNEQIDETEYALNYMNYVLQTMDQQFTPTKQPKPVMKTNLCSKKQQDLICRLYPNEKMDFNNMTKEEASNIINEYYAK